MTNFYIVERNGIPAIWQVDPEGMVSLLKKKSKAGYSVAAELTTKSRTEALAKLRELFPEGRPAKPSTKVL